MAGGKIWRGWAYSIAALPIVGFLLRAFAKVLDGKGEETYLNYRGAELRWSGALVTAGLAFVCMLGAWGYAIWYRRGGKSEPEVFTKGKRRD